MRCCRAGHREGGALSAHRTSCALAGLQAREISGSGGIIVSVGPRKNGGRRGTGGKRGGNVGERGEMGKWPQNVPFFTYFPLIPFPIPLLLSIILANPLPHSFPHVFATIPQFPPFLPSLMTARLPLPE